MFEVFDWDFDETNQSCYRSYEFEKRQKKQSKEHVLQISEGLHSD